MKGLIAKIGRSYQFSLLLRELERPQACVKVGGLTGSLMTLTSAALSQNLERPLLIVVPNASAAETVLDDLAATLGKQRAAYMPPASQGSFDAASLALGPRNERFDALMRFHRAEAPGERMITVTQPEALLENSPNRQWLERNLIILKTGERFDREAMLRRLSQCGYNRERLVDQQGQYAVRGGLMDIFPFGLENPLRLELDEDILFSLRWFDTVTQRSSGETSELRLLIGNEAEASSSGMFDLLPADAIIYWLRTEQLDRRIGAIAQKAASNLQARLGRQPLPADGEIHTLSDLTQRAGAYSQVFVSELDRGRLVDVDFDSLKPDVFTGGIQELPSHLNQYLVRRYDVWMTLDSVAEGERLLESFLETGLVGIHAVTPMLSEGFVCHSARIVTLTAREIFHRRMHRAQHTRFRRRAAIQFDRMALVSGDLVVHAEYGIGRYEGLQMVKVQGHPRECLRIQYADNLLYIPIEHFGMVEKYTGMENARPTLSRISGAEWTRAKKKTVKAIEDMTDELLKLYSQRKVVPGVAFPPDTIWQSEMEASFEFEDTPDQTTATAEIKADLELPHPMDRLLCGDVGFGKTEVAIRAAFKVAQESYQVAVLVPTTILAQQHYETFRERLEAYPLRLEVLSRFRTSAEIKQTLNAIQEGQVDIVIGTHRLLSRDVAFKKLGLLIIDEEHRFGVRHKERIKQIKTSVHVLTMTATPIPRTLHLALMGAWDSSQINTPPVDRLSIQTEVHAWSEDLIRNAILREVDRNGQVFFLHNRIDSIYAVKGMLERLAPGLSYGIAHGQMPERQLEKVMFDFMHGRYDVLVTTIIIESGLDIPNANTLIVNRADKFGLAQLYQIRGRIGRSSRQAYAYLLTPPKMSVSNTALRRLSTLTELTDLGSGMKVALRDLEIRGAGNILGSQQSGFINAVGFELYTRMLNETVRRFRNEEVVAPLQEDTRDVKIDWSGPALLPADYIDDSDLRFGFYRRIAGMSQTAEVDQLEEELKDRFGKIPEPAGNLLTLARLKVLCRLADFSKIRVGLKNLTATFDLPPDPKVAQHRLVMLVSQAAPETIELRMTNPPQLIHPLNSRKSLPEAERFLRHILREGIFND